MSDEQTKSVDFIRAMVARDVESKKHGGEVVTRFPPEPNGYLHIGHAKSICLNFGAAEEFDGRCHLRFDDTNPIKEERQYIDGIQEDIKWLGFDWGKHLYHASDYFQQLYDWAVLLIKGGKAYVDDQSGAELIGQRSDRDDPTKPGVESPYRNRPVEENLDLLERMKNGEFPDGSRVLRAKIDMASPNFSMRDPVMYRILHAVHPHVGDEWCIYPMYDWAHGQSDWIEGITHSLCTLEFEDHRPLYDWYIAQLKELGAKPKGVDYVPTQTEFAKLKLTYVMTSKRKLLELVREKHVTGWDDPRMPTLRGMRRRGYTPESIRSLCDRVGVTRTNSMIDFALLEHCVREDLNKRAERRMAVMNPLRIVIENYPEDQVDQLDAVNNPEDDEAGKRTVPFCRELYIERDDFMEDPPKKFFRLAPGREVRLRYAYFITCNEVVKDSSTGEIVELRCTYDPETRGGDAPDGRKVKATMHWVSAKHALPAQARLYEHLFQTEDPNDAAAGGDYRKNLNPSSLHTQMVHVEPSLAEAKLGQPIQFERIGYFCVDRDSKPGMLVFNRTVTLKDEWARVQQRETAGAAGG